MTPTVLYMNDDNNLLIAFPDALCKSSLTNKNIWLNGFIVVFINLIHTIIIEFFFLFRVV